VIRVYKTGRHAKRTPLSYPALWPLFEMQIELVERPEMADLYLFAHVMDIQEAPEDLVLDWRRRHRPVVLLSEEPFWDTIWGRRPLDPMIFVDTSYGDFSLYENTLLSAYQLPLRKLLPAEVPSKRAAIRR
jgi:hypothetical protein